MRFCYLRIALLTSAIAAVAFADTTKDVKLATSRTASSRTFVRDSSAAPAVTETHEPTSVNDEDRTDLTIKEFAKIIGRRPRIKALEDMKRDHFGQLMANKKITKAVYHDLDLSDPKNNVLFDTNWIRWAFFVSQLGHQFGEDKYKFMMTAMSAIYNAEALSNILITAANFKKTKPLAISLAKVADDRIQSRVLKKIPGLDNELSRQEQHATEKIDETPLDRVNAYLKKHAKNEMLPEDMFSILISYLSVLLSRDYAFNTERAVSHKCAEDAALLQTLLSLENFHDPRCLGNLVSIWLDVSIPPAKIVSMLVKDKAEADHFTILFSNGPSRNFWLHYLEKYNAISTGDSFTQSANHKFEQVLQMLFAVVEQESPATDKFLAYTTILKMLISPSTAHFSSSHENVMKLTSILLWNRTLPSHVLSMLVRGEAYADRFRIFYLNQSSKSFWVRYLKLYNELSKDDEDYTHVANIDFEQSLIMLHDVGVQEETIPHRYLASSTILKILLSPEITNVISSQKYLEEVALNWLEQRLPPSTVVLLLVLEEVETNYFKILFTSEATSKFWEDYMKAYYANPPSLQNHIMSTLTYVFGDANFERILEAALNNEATTEKAKSLIPQYISWKRSLNDNL